MENNNEKKDRIDVKPDDKKVEEKKTISTGDAGFGVDVGYVDRRNYVYD